MHTRLNILAFLSFLVICASPLPRLQAAPVEITSPELRGAIQPQVAVSPRGSIHVAFGMKESGAIYHVASLDGGRTFSKPTEVGRLPKLALGMRRGPRIAATDTVLAITAISHEDGNLHAWSSPDAGATWRKSEQINYVPKRAGEGLHAMAGDGAGNLFLTWLDGRNKGTELWGAASADGGATWGANILVYRSPDGHICECCHPSVMMEGKGRLAVMWRNWLGGSRDMYVAMSADGGKTFNTAQKLGTGTWKLNACPMDGGAIAFGPGGQILTTWRREKAVYATEDDRPEQRLASSAYQSVVAIGSGGTYYLWENEGGLMLRRGSASPVRFASKGRFAAASRMPNRGPIVVWESDRDKAGSLFAQVLD